MILRYIQALDWRHAGAALLCIGALGLCAAHTGTPKYMARLAEDGYPIHIEDLDAWYPPLAEEDNAATYYIRALPPLDWAEQKEDLKQRLSWLKIADDLRKKDEPVSPAVAEDLTAHLEKNAAALQLLYTGAERRRARYTEAWASSRKGNQYVQSLMDGQELLHLDLWRKILDQDAEGATRAIVAMLRVADSVAEEPSVNALLGHVRLAGIALFALEQSLGCLSFSEDQLERLQETLQAPPLHSLDYFMRTFAAVYCVLEEWDGASPSAATETISSPQWIVLTAGRLTGFPAFTRVADAGALREILAQGEMPLLPLAEAMKAYPEPEMISGWAKASEYRTGNPRFAGTTVWPLVPYAYRHPMQLIALASLAEAALAVELYQRTHGALPDALSQLGQEIPQDPFAGAPVSYRRTAGGYLLYSVDLDLEDNGGKPHPEHSYGTDGDLIFEVDHDKVCIEGQAP
jgi:hypothetical protein